MRASMGIHVIALLKGKNLSLAERLHAKALSDGALVHTGIAFGGEPEMLAFGLRSSIGDALDPHDDPRGVFIMPDVAEPKSKDYEGVIAEIGEAGEWIRKAEAGEVPATLTGADAGSFDAMMGAAMQAIGPNLADIQKALASGDYSALANMQKAMADALGGEDKLNALAAQMLGAATEVAGARGSSPSGAGGIDPAELMAAAKELGGALTPEQLAELEKLTKK